MIAWRSSQLLQHLCDLTEPGQPPHHVWIHLQRLWCSAVSGRLPDGSSLHVLAMSRRCYISPFFICRSISTMKSSSLWIQSSTKLWCGWTSSKSIGRQFRWTRPDRSSPVPVIYSSKWTHVTFMFMWPTVHPPGWCGEAGPGWTAGHRWGRGHPSSSG